MLTTCSDSFSDKDFRCEFKTLNGKMSENQVEDKEPMPETVV